MTKKIVDAAVQHVVSWLARLLLAVMVRVAARAARRAMATS